MEEDEGEYFGLFDESLYVVAVAIDDIFVVGFVDSEYAEFAEDLHEVIGEAF